MLLAELLLAGSVLLPFQITGDAIQEPLGGLNGDAARGRALVASRSQGLCLLCHAAPIPEERQQGNLAPDLKGVGARLDAGQLRLRLVAPQQLNPQTFMPAYYRAGPEAGLHRVATDFDGKPVLDAQQIEDVVAYLRTLK
ncbi:sulfur oxidation c-type cytochrome SoxX [Roseateles amylovorans]|jgi:L-cysteine S-thiosulfotransferase|uniref:Sulfur oxidation c-type cytochrome SoxX n=1 Tax=Roseateles amylovorans TaxID=2978473 RepID=A0ABY6B0N7_9BURK|nr:sulfur oxidation c-type cytochrome SoxX [Roseateles amylovorans]UXH78234.1 sulfur oxidation c-type cytochrome SoxX [Roseateles amylovorans]